MKITLYAVFALVALVSVAVGADVAPVTAQPVSIMTWFTQNKAAVLAFTLALSELLSLIPAFKGNGILDTIIKAIKVLSQKDEPSA